MNTTDLRALADRAEGVQGHRDSRLVEVHERIGVARRRRRAAAASGVTAVAAIAVVTAIALRPSAERTTPAPDPTPTPSVPTPVVEDAIDRPLTYAVGQTIHYGDKVVDTGQPIAQVDITDAGVVYVTEDGELWFTDGSRTRFIEQGSRRSDDRTNIAAAATGSLVAWLRREGRLPVEVVVYDAATHKVVFTAPAGASVWPDYDTSQPWSQVVVLTDEQVVAGYSDTFYRGRDFGQLRNVSYDLRTGRRTDLSFDALDDIAVAPPTRSLGWLSRAGDPDNLLRGSTDSYQVRDGLLTVRVFDDRVGQWRVADPVDMVTRDVVRIRAPASGSELRLFQWLDDGVFAMVRMVNRTTMDVGDLVVVCSVSDLRCEVAVEGRQSFVLPGRELYE